MRNEIPPMRGEQLTGFCKELCSAVQRGKLIFRFEDRRYYVAKAIRLADKWLLDEESEQAA